MMDVNPKIGKVFPPNHPHFNRFFGFSHYFHHPLWDTPNFGNTRMISSGTIKSTKTCQ